MTRIAPLSRLSLALAGLLFALPVAGQTADPRIADLIAQERALDIRCLGPEGAILQAPVCDQRRAVAEQLENLGWCYGRLPETGNRSHWHPCPPGAEAARDARMRELLLHPPGTAWPPYRPTR